MNNNETVGMIEKAIANAPDWLMEDINKIEKKANGNMRISYVIHQLYNNYDFSIKHVLGMKEQSDWSLVCRQRLNIIDNNIDLIQAILEKKKRNKQTAK
ncbi:hypothetical protein [Bacillus sp. EB600]|uniref:hypothetical protein n=1 Tax=Bacillus sp. EB600 TaxID=2806345 RepID=UPI00210EF7FA|nr:hypothetical protein [Bacillus sp. EB600]MCQ6278808.1 hypothetical protein [Bacillus sp. EB600]